MQNSVTVKVGSAESQYDVVIGNGLLTELGKAVRSVVGEACKIALFTDDVVDALYADVAKKSLEEVGYDVLKHVIPNGEEHKSIDTYLGGLNFLAENAFTRTDVVVALGGGVVGDLTGFVSATYMRGVRYVQVPTTLLAMTDSSVGGKTGVDLKAGKNLVGAFHRPILVVADVDALGTLPRRQFVNGMGEVIKYACLNGGRILDIVEEGVCKDNLVELISLAVKSKAHIVEEDEFESGKRRLLNLGHTIGHAVETLSGYAVPHGEAVIKGLYAVARACQRTGALSCADLTRLKRIIDSYGVDVDIPYSSKEITACVAHDKKAEGNDLNLVVMRGFGDCQIIRIKVKDVKEYLS